MDASEILVNIEEMFLSTYSSTCVMKLYGRCSSWKQRGRERREIQEEKHSELSPALWVTSKKSAI